MDFQQRQKGKLMEKEQSLKQMLLEQLDIPMKKKLTSI